jgi:hypothetical protein
MSSSPASAPAQATASGSRPSARFPALLYGVLLVLAGMGVYLLGVTGRLLSLLFDPRCQLLGLWQGIVWYAGVPVAGGLILILFEVAVLLPGKRRPRPVMWDPPANPDVTVVLTAYNDEASIGLAVEDFRAHPRVRRVIVVDNNSKDRTAEVAAAAGADVVHESRQGYGRCVWRALAEGARSSDTELTLLCEGDMTFRAYDIDKFAAYIPHAEIVNGTRIVEQLRAPRTQLTTFMYYGNFFVGKLLEFKHIGRGTFTDVGTTYKLCRNSALERLLPLLNPAVNLEFNAHFLDTALGNGFEMVECPVTFHQRLGVSKGGNTNNLRALKVGMAMMLGVIAGWKGRTCQD